MNREMRPRADEIDLGEVAGSLGFLLRLAQVKVFNAFYDNLSKLDLRPGEYTMLWVIGLNPGVRQGVIARTLRIKPAHMTKLVQRAVDAGRVERQIPDDDRRSVHLRLTPVGDAFVDDNRQAFLDQLSRENTSLDRQEHETLIRILQKFNGLERRA